MSSSMLEAFAKALPPEEHQKVRLTPTKSKKESVIMPLPEIRTATIIDREIEEVQHRLAALKKEREAAAVVVTVLDGIVTIAGLTPDGPIRISRLQLLTFVKSNGLAKLKDATTVKGL